MSNKENLREGVCKYCGQIRMVNAKPSIPQEDVNIIASKECDCFSAQMHRKRDRQYEKASVNIEKIFKDRPEMAEILRCAARKIADEQIDVVTVKCGAITAKASVTGKGTIKISRTEKNENSLES